jgi:O-antigen chain-terminating methyltransferase
MIREHEPLDATLKRLAEERERADRAYNDALTALDTALLHLSSLPPAPPEYDERQITPLNESFRTLVEPQIGGGFKGRLSAFVWRIVAPTLQRQVTFNAALVEHLNRNVAAHRDAQRALAAMLDVARTQIADLTAFHTRLLIYLQQITAYVDTKDRETGGRALVVNAAVNALAEDLGKRSESMAAREQRLNAQVSSISAAHEELRAAVGIAQQAVQTTRRELERLLNARDLNVAPTGGRDRPVDPSSSAGVPQASNPLDSYKYVEFENLYRGSQDAIRSRLESYLPYFDGAADVLDVGCGRGEFLDLLNARGISSRGLDLNHEMVEVCRARGLEVTESDAVTSLERQPDGALGGLFAAQVVEHLQPGYLLRFLDLAFQKLRPGAPIVLETLNPACWTAFFDSFIRDITHVWPLHPDTLRYLVLASGFPSARIEYRSPVAAQDRLQPVPHRGGNGSSAGQGGDTDGATADFIETFNANVEKLNARMFTFLDYAIVGSR